MWWIYWSVWFRSLQILYGLYLFRVYMYLWTPLLCGCNERKAFINNTFNCIKIYDGYSGKLCVHSNKTQILIYKWNIFILYLQWIFYLIEHWSYLIYFCAEWIKLCRVESITGRKSRKLPRKAEMKETGGAAQHVPTYLPCYHPPHAL